MSQLNFKKKGMTIIFVHILSASVILGEAREIYTVDVYTRVDKLYIRWDMRGDSVRPAITPEQVIFGAARLTQENASFASLPE